ncbi:MAG: DUF3795 domain-containing protein [Dehalococcoidales bacterium]
MDKYPLKKYPIVGACGLSCGLCPRYYTEGPSRCPGCCGPGFWQKHPACGFITCCVKKRGLETCAQCGDRAECARVARLLESARYQDSFLSHRSLAANFALIQEKGIKEFARLEMAKQDCLRRLIDNYNDGRSKTLYCTSCQLIPLDKLKQALADAETKMDKGADIKERTKIVRAAISNIADSLQIDLKLRK